MERGMTGATGNFYCGLHEHADMLFVLRLLRDGDTFADVGANVGSYSVLASGHCGATTVAVEPLPVTYEKLCSNIRYNKIEQLVEPKNVGVGDAKGTLRFTDSLDTVNHVVPSGSNKKGGVEVPVERLDDLLSGYAPICIKIDVEGFEQKVLDGATGVLESRSTQAVLLELNESGKRYGFSDNDIHLAMTRHGFIAFRYIPERSTLSRIDGKNEMQGNTLYLRDVEFIRDRLCTAERVDLPWRTIAAQPTVTIEQG